MASSSGDYTERVAAALDFLTGRKVAVLDRLKEDMQAAAEGQRYEWAARLRDAHGDLSQLSLLLQRLREAREYTFVYPVRGARGKTKWYMLREGQVVAACPAPRDPQTSRTCLEGLDTAFSERQPAAPSPPAGEVDGLLLVAGWFDRNRDELRSALSPEEARNICRHKAPR
jgi:hypothetical protein